MMKHPTHRAVPIEVVCTKYGTTQIPKVADKHLLLTFNLSMLIAIRASHSKIYNNVHKGAYVSFSDLPGLYNLVTGSKPMKGKLTKIWRDK
jgi:hypothetical protein